MVHAVKILEILPLTHDVKRYKTEKPKGYVFMPGQATEVSINHPEWREEKRPFTFTNLPEEDRLEFVVKSYRDHRGVTNQLDTLQAGDELLIEDAWGTIQYKGKGVFIAGGAGITPFISIFKSLQSSGRLSGNSLLFANKTGKDIIMESFFRYLLGGNFISVLDQEKLPGHEYGRIDRAFLEKHVQDFSQDFYICGPDPMIQAVGKSLEQLGAKPEAIVFEK